jgi:hypothetical protein
MRDYLDGDMAGFCAHAGIALEQLAKAYLANIDPTLVVDGRSFDSILHACGKGRHARSPASLMKTITMEDALRRCGQILPAVENLRGDLQRLIDARNGAIHVGAVEESEKLRMLLPYLHASRQILGEGGFGEEYWGEFNEVVELRVAEVTEAAVANVKEAMIAASLRFDERYGHLGEEVRPAVLRALEASYAPEKYEQQLVDCPACSTLGLASGSTDVDWQPDWDQSDGQDYVAGMYPEVTFFPGRFECHACDLALDGEVEIEAAGIESSWKLDDVDVADFAEDLYYDDY